MKNNYSINNNRSELIWLFSAKSLMKIPREVLLPKIFINTKRPVAAVLRFTVHPTTDINTISNLWEKLNLS